MLISLECVPNYASTIGQNLYTANMFQSRVTIAIDTRMTHDQFAFSLTKDEFKWLIGNKID